MDCLLIGICYFGFGIFFSRFFDTVIRNNPLFWIFLSMMTVPLYVSVRSLFGPVPHIEILFLSATGICSSFLLHCKKVFRLLPEAKVKKSTILILSNIALVFFGALVLAKHGLIIGDGSVTSSWDDFARIRVIVELGYDLRIPASYRAYHHFGYILPGIVFRTSSLSAQSALFVHNFLEYASILTIVVYTGTYLFRHTVAKITFVLMSTVCGGGLEYFFYRIRGDGIPFGLAIEWWNRQIGSLGGNGYQFEWWSMFYLYEWASHHAFAMTMFLFIIILLTQKRLLANAILAAGIAGGLVGFSVFVFITGVSSLLITQAWDWLCFYWRERKRLKQSKIWGRTFAMQSFLCAAAFFVFFWPQFARYYTQHPQGKTIIKAAESGFITENPIIFHFVHFSDFLSSPIGRRIPSGFHSALHLIEGPIEQIFTWSYVIFIDTGWICILALCFFLFAKTDRKDLIAKSTLLLGCIVTIFIIFNYRSPNVNDLFLRGSLVFQVYATIAAAIFIDKCGASTRATYMIIPLLLLMNASNFYQASASQIRFQSWGIDAFKSFVMKQTPKNATLYSDTICDINHHLFFYNRHCIKHSWEQIQEEELGSLSMPAYYVNEVPLFDPQLQEVYGVEGRYIYKILE